jgi:casein kinase II subunit beta
VTLGGGRASDLSQLLTVRQPSEQFHPYTALQRILPQFRDNVSTVTGSTLAEGLERLDLSPLSAPTPSTSAFSSFAMSSSEGSPESWISSFCSLMGHEYFAEVSEDFIEDDFNLTGLQSQVPMYKEALEMILDVEPEDDDEEEEEEEEDEDEDEILGDEKPLGYRKTGDRRHMRVASDLSVIESSAELLYGLIHQRYITSRPGIQQMLEKYEMQHFGVCPRVYCNGCKVLPVGRTDTPGQETVKLFCPSCYDIYTPPNSRFQSVDGAFFGTTFGCLFFMTFPELDVGGNRAESILSPTSISAATNANQSRSSSMNSSVAVALTTPEPPPNQPTQMNGMLTSNFAPGLGPGKIYEPRIYGFRVSERAKSGPRMQWLRMKPLDINELDESTIYHAAHGNDEEDYDEGDTEMGTGAGSHQSAIGTRRKAPMRKRRQLPSNNTDRMVSNGGEGG